MNTLFIVYRIRYQAVGSSVVQYTRLIDRSTNYYEISHLHENTNYEICVLRLETAPSRLGTGSRRPPTSLFAMHSTDRAADRLTVAGGPRALSVRMRRNGFMSTSGRKSDPAPLLLTY